MSFTSWTFLPFIAVVLPLYYALPFRKQNAMLAAASCVFYGAWDVRFLALLLFSIGMDYVLGHRLEQTEDPSKRKTILIVSVVLNLGILGFFKYFNFFAESLVALLRGFGFDVPPVYVEVLLPIGISFYTFHSMSYIIDIYRRAMAPMMHFSDYALYVLYFPQLVAGPIARAHDVIPQFERPRVVTRTFVVEGLWLILWGYFKKLVIADNLAPIANGVFESRYPAGGVSCLLAIYAFAFQIYGDFSGYTDIARGLGKLMGIELTLNFNLPYFARNPSDFWRRWHISLSTWLRDYLYISLGGNRFGALATYRNLLLTMVLGGLWHGASWHFVAWGTYHGVLLALHGWLSGRVVRGGGPLLPHLPGWLTVLGMFHLTCLGWLIFRASTLRQVAGFLARIATDFSIDSQAARMLGPVVALPALLLAVELWLRNSDDPRTRPGWNRGLGPLAVAALVVLIVVLAPMDNANFIYFQF
jgi:alginate O-acetyltransferase complex protein AlgI